MSFVCLALNQSLFPLFVFPPLLTWRAVVSLGDDVALLALAGDGPARVAVDDAADLVAGAQVPLVAWVGAPQLVVTGLLAGAVLVDAALRLGRGLN